jgi:ABC-type lipoprotein release transport system permease subunit
MDTILFEIRLALAKLWINRRRSLAKSLFFALLFSVIFTALLFLAGSDQQMIRSIQLVQGEASCFASASGDAIPDISVMAEDIAREHQGTLRDVQGAFIAGVGLNSDKAMVMATASGVEESFLPYLNQAVAWQGSSVASFSQDGVLLEASLAEALFVKPGDYLTIQWHFATTGRTNTIYVPINGVFVGSGLLFGKQLFVGLPVMQSLIMENSAINQLRLYFSTQDEEAIRTTLRAINAKYYDLVSIESVLLDPYGGIFGVYKNYNLLIQFVLWALTIIFFVIIYYSNQNVFFMEYRRRRAELATFLTYGTSPGRMKRIVVWEALVQTLAGVLLSSVLTTALVSLLGQFQINNLAYADLITAIGGPRLLFSFNVQVMSLAGVGLVLLMVLAALKGAGRYLKREIREIIGSSD